MKYLYPDSPVKYIIVVKVETIDVGNYNPMYMYNHRAGSAWMCGKMFVIDVASGESIFEADIEKARSYGVATNFVWRFGDLISCELLVNDIYTPVYSKK